MAKTITKKVTRYRSADDGQYITKKEADRKPKESVKETDKIKVKVPSKKK